MDTKKSDPLWYCDAVFYEVFVRAFADGNGDGIGDLPGLTAKLDYLQWLGVDAVWLLPIFPSPLRDDGYDVADYFAIHPDYGTLDDLRRQVPAAQVHVVAAQAAFVSDALSLWKPILAAMEGT